jgi:hypothetical protein
MPVIGAKAMTLRDLASGLRADNKFDHDIVDLMAQSNEILDDIPFTEANDGTSDLTTIRTGLPSVSWNSHYEGTQASKGQKQQVVNGSGHMSSLLEIDKRLLDSGDEAVRNAQIEDEVSAHLEAMGQDAATAIFYGDIKSEARKINGLGIIYSKIGGHVADANVSTHYVFNGSMSVPAVGAADLRSIWLLNWGRSTMRGFYPQGSGGGIKRGAFKDAWVNDENGNPYEVKRQLFGWDIGLAVRDYRYGGRIANIQVNNMLATSGQPEYLELINRLKGRVRISPNAKRVWYMPRLVWENLEILFGRATRSNAIKYEDVDQRLAVARLFGYPVRLTDALDVNEVPVPLV